MKDNVVHYQLSQGNHLIPECRGLILICRLILISCSFCHGGTWWRRWLSASRKVTGSIPSGVGIFHWCDPGHIMAVGLTQPITEMSRRNIFLGSKGGWCIGLTALPPSCAYHCEIREPKPLLKPQVLSRHVQGLLFFNLLPEQLPSELSEYYEIEVLDRCNGTSHIFMFQAVFWV